MTILPTRRTVTLLAALSIAACSSSSPTNTPDAAVADAPAVDVPAVDVSQSTDGAAAGDGGGCEDFSGAYTLTGTCSVPGFSPFPSACIAQTGCSAQIVVTTGSTTGTVSGNTLSFMSMVSGIPLSCTATRQAGGTITVQCDAGGLASCEATGEPASFPGATRWCCNPSAQDCGSGQRCNLVGTGMGNNVALTACVPAGTVAEGATCTRTGGRLGADDCGVGLSCVNYGQASATERACHRLCRNSSDCMGGASCLAVSDAPRAGICRPRCELLGSDCPMGTCRYLNAWTTMDESSAATMVTACLPMGDGVEGGMCSNSNDCGANLLCVRSSASAQGACRRVCDSTHACPAGTNCNGTMSATNPTAAGACVP